MMSSIARARARAALVHHHLRGVPRRRALSISASEARAEVAEVYASKTNYAGIMSAKAELAIISAAEARADVAEVYASKEEDGDWRGKDNAAAATPQQPVYECKVNPVTSAVKAKAEVAEARTARDR